MGNFSTIQFYRYRHCIDYFTKEDLYVILCTMGYFKSKHQDNDHMTSFEEKSLEYIYRISKQKLSNLKTILL